MTVAASTPLAADVADDRVPPSARPSRPAGDRSATSGRQPPGIPGGARRGQHVVEVAEDTGPVGRGEVTRGDLRWPVAGSGESLRTSLAGRRIVDQAVGVLVDRGLPPEEARRELRRRADDAHIDVAAASRRLLESLRPGPD